MATIDYKKGTIQIDKDYVISENATSTLIENILMRYGIIAKKELSIDDIWKLYCRKMGINSDGSITENKVFRCYSYLKACEWYFNAKDNDLDLLPGFWTITEHGVIFCTANLYGLSVKFKTRKGAETARELIPEYLLKAYFE